MMLTGESPSPAWVCVISRWSTIASASMRAMSTCLNRTLREEFVAMHSEPLMANFFKEQLLATGIALPSLPRPDPPRHHQRQRQTFIVLFLTFWYGRR